MTDSRFTGYGWRWAASMTRRPLREVLQQDDRRRTMDLEQQLQLLDVVVRRNAAVLRALSDPMTEGWRHIDSGLDYVHLVNGYEFRETDDGLDISIQRMDELHAVIARAIIASSLPLRGQEVRFLRSVLRLSPAGLALATHLSKAAFERWEAEPDAPIPGPAAIALRRFYQERTGVLIVPVAAGSREMRFKLSMNGWRQA
jgi:DNA-binding transcriptional regulator YiaG